MSSTKRFCVTNAYTSLVLSTAIPKREQMESWNFQRMTRCLSTTRFIGYTATNSYYERAKDHSEERKCWRRTHTHLSCRISSSCRRGSAWMSCAIRFWMLSRTLIFNTMLYRRLRTLRRYMKAPILQANIGFTPYPHGSSTTYFLLFSATKKASMIDRSSLPKH
jgi:hypothetical protein